MIGIAVGAVFFAWLFRSERNDIMCNGECFEGNSKYFASGKASKDDSLDETIKKIEYLNTVPNRVVVWRRSFIFAFVAALVLTYMGKGRRYFIVKLLVIFIAFMAMFSFYRFHFDVYPQGMLQENVNVLRKTLEKPKVSQTSEKFEELVKILQGKSLPK